MKTNIQYLLLSILAICGMLASCTEETPLNHASGNSSSGKVVLSYSVSNPVQSRAEDEGWQDFNENKVTRLDLFIFPTGNDRNVIYYNETFDNNNDPQTGAYTTWNIPRTSISPDMLETGDEVYLIANYDFTSPSSITSKSDLDITLRDLDCDAKQYDFVMTGKAIVNKSSTSNDVTIQVDLIRVAAKICLSFASQTDWNEVSYRFVHYAQTSALLEENETEHVASQVLSISPSEDGLTEVNTQTTENLYSDEGKQKLVLYSYANDWYKKGGGYENPDVNGGTQMGDDQIYQQEPIDEAKQTYILLRAPYNNDYYYYKVPVNFRLPENNDDVNINPDAYKHLYRLQRNYIYDITVTIDREGGPESEPVTPKLYYQVLPFDEETINIPAFE